MTLCEGDFMKKKYAICGLIICFVAIVIYLQFGREEMIVNTRIDSFEGGYDEEVCIVANKVFIWDKERYAEELVERIIQNEFKKVRFSYDIVGYPKKIRISVYNNKLAYRHNKKVLILYI